jgi:hypothetical protein
VDACLLLHANLLNLPSTVAVLIAAAAAAALPCYFASWPGNGWHCFHESFIVQGI